MSRGLRGVTRSRANFPRLSPTCTRVSDFYVIVKVTEVVLLLGLSFPLTYLQLRAEQHYHAFLS